MLYWKAARESRSTTLESKKGIAMERNKIQTLIELSLSFEEADQVIEQYTGLKTDKEKIAYLRGMFDCRIIGRTGTDIHTDYVALLTAIINEKWR